MPGGKLSLMRAVACSALARWRGSAVNGQLLSLRMVLEFFFISSNRVFIVTTSERHRFGQLSGNFSKNREIWDKPAIAGWFWPLTWDRKHRDKPTRGKVPSRPRRDP